MLAASNAIADYCMINCLGGAPLAVFPPLIVYALLCTALGIPY